MWDLGLFSKVRTVQLVTTLLQLHYKEVLQLSFISLGCKFHANWQSIVTEKHKHRQMHIYIHTYNTTRPFNLQLRSLQKSVIHFGHILCH